MIRPVANALSIADFSTLRCDGCGIYDPSLRVSTHPTIVSFLVSASESSRMGMWCARCRAIQSTKATAVSLLAGWWSPRGPMLTVAAVRANLKGGAQQPASNAHLLRGIARFEYDSGNPELAAMFAREAQSVQPQFENRRFLEELERAGHRIPFPNSTWRFAPFAPILVFALALLVLGGRMMSGTEEEAPVVATPIQRAAAAQPKTAPRTLWDRNGNADQLEKALKTNPDPDLARAYFKARLRETQSEIPLRVRRGDNLWSLEASIRAFGSTPGAAKLFGNSALKTAYENLLAVLYESNRYYHGGAPVEVIERHAGETLKATVAVAFTAIDADARGLEDKRDELATEANQGAAAMAEMRRDLRIRAAVISVTNQAINECLRLMGS